MHSKQTILIIFVLIVLGLLYWIFSGFFHGIGIGQNAKIPSDPLNATYTIEGKQVKLTNGTNSVPSAPGSASQTITKAFGQASFGDLDGDGVDDAVTFVTQDSGGSGTFYYAAVALNKGGNFEGLSAISLGDRIAPQSILIKDGVAMVNYADRNPGDPMTVAPSVGVTKYLTVESGAVKEFNLLSTGEQFFAGNLIMAPEVRIFTPCGGTAHWIIGTSTAYATLTKAYNENKSTSSPYSSVYAVVSGVVVSPPTDGFGMDYSYGIDIKNLLKVIPGKTCPQS